MSNEPKLLAELAGEVIELHLSIARWNLSARFHGKISGRVCKIYGDSTGLNVWVGDFCFGPETLVDKKGPGEYALYVTIAEKCTN